MQELGNLKKGGNASISNYTSCAKGIHYELCMLGNQVNEDTHVLWIIQGLSVGNEVIKTVQGNMNGNRNFDDVSAKQLSVEHRGNQGRSFSMAGARSQAFAATASKKPCDTRAAE